MILNPAEILRLLNAIRTDQPNITADTACTALAAALDDPFVFDAILDAAARHASKTQSNTGPDARRPVNYAAIALRSILTAAAKLESAAVFDDRHIRLPAALWVQFCDLCTDADTHAAPDPKKTPARHAADIS